MRWQGQRTEGRGAWQKSARFTLSSDKRDLPFIYCSRRWE
jgi:hypothetical protein